MTKNRRSMTVSAALTLLLGCGGGDGGDEKPPIVAPPVPTSGRVVLSLGAAPSSIAAIRVRVVGSGMSSPSARGSGRILLQQTSADTSVFVVAVSSGAGAFLEIGLVDRDRLPSVLVEEATAGRLFGYQALPASSVVVERLRQ